MLLRLFTIHDVCIIAVQFRGRLSVWKWCAGLIVGARERETSRYITLPDLDIKRPVLGGARCGKVNVESCAVDCSKVEQWASLTTKGRLEKTMLGQSTELQLFISSLTFATVAVEQPREIYTVHVP